MDLLSKVYFTQPGQCSEVTVPAEDSAVSEEQELPGPGAGHMQHRSSPQTTTNHIAAAGRYLEEHAQKINSREGCRFFSSLSPPPESEAERLTDF